MTQDPRRSRLGELVARLSGLAVLGLGALFLLLLAFNVLRTPWGTLSNAGRAVHFGLPLGLSLLCFSQFRNTRAAGRVVFVREIGVTILAFLVAEAFLVAFLVDDSDPLLAKKAIADRLGIEFDTRSKTEVVAALRAKGLDALPSFPVSLLRRPDVKRYAPEELYPLGNVSNAHIVECNETGEYMVYESDEHGFNNPKGHYRKGAFDVALVGASFTLGYCVKSDENMVARVREVYPNTLGFGMGGGFALATLGMLREFVEPYQPPMVIWVSLPWCVKMKTPHESPILVKYLDPGFSQDLRDRQDEVDALLRRITPLVEADFHRAAAHAGADLQHQLWTGVPRLRQLRERLFPAERLAPDPPVDPRPFQEVIRLAKKTVEGWGGRFYFLHIPSYGETVAGTLPAQFCQEHIASIIAPLGVPLIDGVEAFRRHPDPPSLYSLRSANHLSPAGYRVLGDLILERIEPDMDAILAKD